MGIFGLFGPPNTEKLKAKNDVNGLIKALNYPKSWQVRRAAAKALGEMGDTRAVAPLIAALNDRDSDCVTEALKALGKIGDAQAIDPIITKLKEVPSYTNTYRAAVEVLGEMGDTRALPTLISVLEENVFNMSGTEIKSLKTFLSDKEISSIIEKAKRKKANDLIKELDADSASADKAYEKLYHMGEALVADELIATIKTIKSVHGKFKAIELLKRVRDKNATKTFIRVLKNEKDHFIRSTSAEALGYLSDQKAIPPLLQALQDREYGVRRAAAAALKMLGWQPANDTERALFAVASMQWKETVSLGTSAIDSLAFALKDEHRQIRAEAAKALGQIKDHKVIDLLLAALRDETDDYEAGIAIIEALGQLRDSRAIEPLSILLQNSSKQALYNRILQALQMLGWQPEDEAQRAELAVANRDWKQAASIGTVAIKPLRTALSHEEHQVRSMAAQTLAQMGAVDPLITSLRELWPHLREIPAAALKALAKADMSNLSLEDLRKLAKIENTTGENIIEASDPQWDYGRSETFVIDLSDVRQQAQQELTRRGEQI